MWAAGSVGGAVGGSGRQTEEEDIQQIATEINHQDREESAVVLGSLNSKWILGQHVQAYWTIHCVHACVT